MPTMIRIFATAALALALHLVLGWAWTVVAGFAAGFWVVLRAPAGGSLGRHGWLVGTLGVGIEWAALVLYNFIVAGGAIGRMVHTVGGLLGNLPGFAVVLLTVLLGAVLGAVGGLAGAQAARLFSKSEQRRAHLV